MAQLVKHLPAMKETQVLSLVREDPLQKGDFIQKAADREDGRLVPQNNHFMGSGYQVLF